MARVGRIVVPGMAHHVPIGDDGFPASIGRLLGRDLAPPKTPAATERAHQWPARGGKCGILRVCPVRRVRRCPPSMAGAIVVFSDGECH